MFERSSESLDNFIRGPWQTFKKGPIVALTGAGISEESGIPTFRGESGLWSRYDPAVFAHPAGLLSVLNEQPARLVDFLEDLYSILSRAKPNAAHRALVQMEKDKILHCVITQNIDNLHQEAGSREVLELHGNAFCLRCDDCGRQMHLNKKGLSAIIERLGKAKGSYRQVLKGLSRFFPRCRCRKRFRIDIVLFGEFLSAGVLEKSYQRIDDCALLIVAGTSGMVYPAASLPFYAKDKGIKILEINSEPSNLSVISDYQLMGKAGEILPELAKKL